jgi:hypothetical protein
MKNWFKNKEKEYFYEILESLTNRIESIEYNIEYIEFKINNPQPYKIGEKYSKDEIVTNIQPKKRKIHFALREKLFWEIEIINIKTGTKKINYI